jgi:uncharacterized membrane protein YccC
MTRWPLLSPGWSHAICTTIAVILALYIAYFLQLESPYSAATTVLIVASPVHGMVLAKSVYRFLGTLVGAAASVALMACFAQTPELFLLGTAIWVGIFTAISTLLRRFRAYGAVLAGYTITLVAFGAVDNPLQIFDLAMARVAVVSIGIACSALVTILLAPNTASRDLPVKLHTVLQSLATLVRLALSSAPETEVTTRRWEAARQVQALDTALYGAAAESAEMAARSGYMRGAVAASFGILTSVSSLRASCEQVQRPQLWRLSQDAADLLDRVAAEGISITLSDDINALRQSAESAQVDIDAEQDLDLMIAFNRLDDLLDHLASLTENLRSFADKTAPRSDIRLPHHRDLPAALINGFRGMFAVLVLSVFWIYSAWPNGSQLFGAMVPICALLGVSDRQQADSISFFIGISLAALIGLICSFGLLTQVSGFPLLALTISPFVLIAVYYTTKPKTAGIATGFLIYFLTLIAPRNPMQFDLASYLNTAFANVVGIGCLLPVFRLVFPQNHRRTARDLARRMAQSLKQLAAKPRPDYLLQWEHRAHDQLASIGGHLPPADQERSVLLNGGLATLRIGRELFRIRSQLAPLSLDQVTLKLMARAFAACKHVTTRPARVAQRFLDAAARLDAVTTEIQGEGGNRTKRSAVALRECADLLTRYSNFFTGKPAKGLVAGRQALGEASIC